MRFSLVFMIKQLSFKHMENLKSNLCAYADFLDSNDCEFVIIAREGDSGMATALLSDQSIGLLAGVFDKSPYVYQAFKMAEDYMNTNKTICNN